MSRGETDTFWVKIYLAGPIEVAKQILRRECKREGLCVNIYPTSYIYTGGEETGYVVEFINYPRFPKTNDEIFNRALGIALMLKSETFQDSFTIATPSTTIWESDR